MKRTAFACLVPALLALPLAAVAQGLPAVTVSSGGGGQTYTLTVQVMLLMTLLTVLPALVLGMTAFTRIIVVLALLRQALGLATTPPNQVLISLALFLTLFVMSSTFTQSWNEGVKPYMDGSLAAEPALTRAIAPFRSFMLRQTRESDLASFARISGQGPVDGPESVPLTLLIPSFMTSELKTAFQIGFMIFIPFLVIDLVVASVLMSMGMMMLSPMLISLPFKLMLFVLVDGWTLLMGTLASSFAV